MLKLYAWEQEAQWHELEVQEEASDGGDGRPGISGSPSKAEIGTVSNFEESKEAKARWSHMWWSLPL